MPREDCGLLLVGEVTSGFITSSARRGFNEANCGVERADCVARSAKSPAVEEMFSACGRRGVEAARRWRWRREGELMEVQLPATASWLPRWIALRPDGTVPAVQTIREIRASLIDLARRHSRVAHEVEDLAHDIILSALRRGSALDGEAFLRSALGAARRHAAFLARSAARRRAREVSSAGEQVAHGDIHAEHDGEGAPLSVLSPTLRTTLLLLLLGLDKAELRLALDVTDAALRKRFQALREHAPLARPDLPMAERTPALARLRRSQVGLLPRLAARLMGEGLARRVLAASDPDGHGLIFTEVLTPGRRTATPSASSD